MFTKCVERLTKFVEKRTKSVTQEMILGHNSRKGAEKIVSGNLECLHQELCNEKKIA